MSRNAGRWGHRLSASLLAALLLLAGCAELAPLRYPPADPLQDFAAVTTREEAVRLFGQPDDIRSSDTGLVLIYRRPVVINANANAFYGMDEPYTDLYKRHQRVLPYVDDAGKVI